MSLSRPEHVMQIPADVYEELMSRPDGADVSDLFEFEDPAWNKAMTVTKGTKMADTNPCSNGHNWVPGAPVVHADGSKSPRLICTRCPAEQK